MYLIFSAKNGGQFFFISKKYYAHVYSFFMSDVYGIYCFPNHSTSSTKHRI